MDEKKIYHKAKLSAMFLSCATQGCGTVFYLMIGFASYAATQGFGIPVAVAGVLLMVARIFDGVVDLVLAPLFDRWRPGKHGKIRIYILIAWAFMASAAILMYIIFAGKVEGILAIAVFLLLYALHAIGYTMLGIGGFTVQAVITNDPVQRPFLNFISTGYSYLVPMALTTLISFAILPRYDNQYNMACLGEVALWFSLISLVLVLLACIGVRTVDNDEYLGGIHASDGQKIGWRDMWSLLKNNRPMRMFILTAASDKIAQQVSSQSIVATLMSGILIANYQASTMIGNAGMIVGLIFALMGGAYIAKKGAKTATTVWSWVSILLSCGAIVFCTILGPDGMKQIGSFGVPMMIYVVIMISTTGIRMILTTAAGTMRSDIIDYERLRSGNYLPGIVSSVYNFIDTAVSASASMIAGFAVAFIGYSDTVPQMGDEATWPLFVVTMVLMYGLPIAGWLCNIFAMKRYELSKERMVEVQTQIAEEKQKAAAES